MIQLILLFISMGISAACDSANKSSGTVAATPANAPAQQTSVETALPADKTGGFDGARAFEFVRSQVAFGPRPAGSEANHKTQQFILSTLKGFGCEVDEDNFLASTPQGRVPMKNIVAKISGENASVILMLTHYDTKLLPNFVGAMDGGSSTAIMLELARQLCGKKHTLTYWIAFLDGEEAFHEQWLDPDNTYGSREMAAKLNNEGELKRVKAVVLADLLGEAGAKFNPKREGNSTKWLRDIVWETAKRLGYGQYFLEEEVPGISDDHEAFLKRGVPAVDIIDLEYEWWHTPQDTLDKVSARSLGIAGHVILASLPEIEKKVSKK